MSKIERDFNRMLDEYGLTVLSKVSGSRHTKFRLRNSHGDTRLYVLSRCASGWTPRIEMNARAELRRFARGKGPSDAVGDRREPLAY